MCHSTQQRTGGQADGRPPNGVAVLWNPVNRRVKTREGEAGMVKRREHGQFGRFQVHLPVDIPRLDDVTKRSVARGRCQSAGQALVRSRCGSGRPDTHRHRVIAPTPHALSRCSGSKAPSQFCYRCHAPQGQMHLRVITSPSCRPPPHLISPGVCDCGDCPRQPPTGCGFWGLFGL